MHTLNLKLPVDLFFKLRKYSKHKGQTVSSMLRFIVEAYLNEHGEEDGK